MFNRTHMLIGFYQLMLGMVGALLIQLIFIHQRPLFATVNITKIVDEFVKQTAKLNLSPIAKERQVKMFSLKLNHSLQLIASEQHIILFPNEAVIAGSRDLTREVQENMKREATS